MRTRDSQTPIKPFEFTPLDLARAQELKTLINLATRQQQALVIEPGEGVTETAELDLISPNENTNGLVRFQRHYSSTAARRM